MLDNKTIIKVTNRDRGSVSYRIDDLGIRRHYESGETKEVTYEEILKLSYTTGGKRLLESCLVIDNEEAVAAILGGVEPEYYYTEEEIKDLLLNGSLDALKDCLDFAPEGTIGLVEKLATDLKIADIYKREAIKAKTGVDITKAIELEEYVSENTEENKPMMRRVTENTEKKTEVTTTPTRRTTTVIASPKYKTITK